MKIIDTNIKIVLNYQNGSSENQNYNFYYEMLRNFLDEKKLSENFFGNLMKKNLPMKELNYIESNLRFKNLLSTYLPFVETKIELFVKTRNDFFNLKIYEEIFKGNFEKEIVLPVIEDIFLEKKWENCLKIFFLSPKKKEIYINQKNKLSSKKSKNKILKTNNFKIPKKTDIIIFITGGGFSADLELLAQFYLRE